MDYWIPYQLYNCDRQSLEIGMDLTENVINAAQTILKNQFGMGGFQDTALATYLKFVPISPSVVSVQILHTGRYTYRKYSLLTILTYTLEYLHVMSRNYFRVAKRVYGIWHVICGTQYLH